MFRFIFPQCMRNSLRVLASRSKFFSASESLKNIPLQQPLDQELLYPKDPESSKPLTDSSFYPLTSVSKFTLPLSELFSPFDISGLWLSS